MGVGTETTTVGRCKLETSKNAVAWGSSRASAWEAGPVWSMSWCNRL